MLDVYILTGLDTHGQRKQRLVELAVATALARGDMFLGGILSVNRRCHTHYME